MAVSTGDPTLGHLGAEDFTKRFSPNDYIELKKEEISSPKYSTITNVSHCFLFARNNSKILKLYNPRAAVLMHMRFDGFLGFPGGKVDAGEDRLAALNREMVEEINFDVNTHKVTEDNYVVSHYSPSKNTCLHFYALELSLEEIKKVEEDCLKSRDYGSEVLGTIRVPLYTMVDGYRGLPAFLTQSFIGNARCQLLFTLKKLNILTEEEILLALNPTAQTLSLKS